MKKTIVSILIAALLLVFVVYSQLTDAPVSEQLTLTLTPAKVRVLLLEPIPVRIGIENRTDTTLPLKSPLALQSIKLAIEKPDGRVVTQKQLTYFNARIGGGIGDIASGGKREKKEILEFELLKWFDKPGQYRIKASFRNGESTLSSDWIALTVEEPQGKDAEAFDFLRTRVTLPSVILASTTNVREEFVEKFPGSPYADYMRYVLAQGYEGRDNTRAIALYKQLQSNLDFIFANEINDRLKSLEPSNE